MNGYVFNKALTTIPTVATPQIPMLSINNYFVATKKWCKNEALPLSKNMCVGQRKERKKSSLGSTTCLVPN